MRRALGALALLVGGALVPLADAAPGGRFDGCASPDAEVAVGVVSCRTLPSRELGGTTAYSYYVPPGCAERRCPTIYLLHGFGGDHTSMLGTAARPSSWVRALTRRPAVDPAATAAPWEHADPAAWVPAPRLDAVLVAPDGRTVPGGHGPMADLEGFWADWNPRYARDGDTPRYDTPAPRFATHVATELVADVERRLPVGRGRAWRALAGTSLGGYGAYAIGLLHPDRWASIGSVSGIMNILLLPGLDPVPGGAPVGAQPPGPVPSRPLPGAAGAAVPLDRMPEQARDFAVATYAFGDPAADGAYYRGRMPRDLALNGRAVRGSTPALDIRGFSNDAVPRRAADLSLPGYLVAQGFEDIVLASNLEMNAAFAATGTPYAYALRPGLHSGPYWDPWLRGQLEEHYARLRHADGTGRPPPTPSRFSYRSTERAFAVWGWRVEVDRPTLEFLQLDDVSCEGFTVRGTGAVTVRVPAACRTGLRGSRIVDVDLGPAQPTDAPAGADAAPMWGRTVRVDLTSLRR